MPDRPLGIPLTCKEHAAADVRPPVPGVPGRHHARQHAAAGRRKLADQHAEIGLTGHHSTSHHGNNPENLKKSTLLDHSLLIYGSGMSDGNWHNNLSVPVVMVAASPTKASCARPTPPEKIP